MTVDLARHDQLVQTTRVWVAQTFYGQMLKQMRNSPFKSDLFDGGRGGQAFQAQLDQRLAERMANGRAADRLVNSIVKSIERKAKPGVAPAPETRSSADVATAR
jgi:Rod binding domain-containing protein